MWSFSNVAVNDIDLHVATAGEPDRDVVVFLHGFPEYWIAWRPVMERLADRYRVVAPDQRGYNQSSKPSDVDAYRVRHMVADLDALADQISPGRRFVLAGHDWGASVAYAYAFAHPGRLKALVVANGVHPGCFQRAIFEDPLQRQASQYINRLRASDAEDRLAADGYRRLIAMLANFSSTNWMDAEIADTYCEAWSRPGALTAMLNWYRASPLSVPAPGEPGLPSPIDGLAQEAMQVHMPHLVIWGRDDQALRPSCLKGLDRFAEDLVIDEIDGTGHWLLHEAPDRVAASIRAFLAKVG